MSTGLRADATLAKLLTYMCAVFFIFAAPASADELASRQQLPAIKESRSLAAEADLAISLANTGKISSTFLTMLLTQANDKLSSAADQLGDVPRASQLVALAMAALSDRDLAELRAVTRQLLELEDSE